MEDAPAPKRVKAEGGWAAAAEATDDSHAQIKPEPDLSAAGELLLSKRDSGAANCSCSSQSNVMLSCLHHSVSCCHAHLFALHDHRCNMYTRAGTAAALEWESIKGESAEAKAEPVAAAGGMAVGFELPDDVADGDDDLEWDDV
jgi:hypothetical protein